VLLDQQDGKVVPEFLDQLVLLVLKEIRGHMDPRGHRVLWDQMVILEILDLKVQLDQLDRKVKEVAKVHKALRVMKALKALKVQWV